MNDAQEQFEKKVAAFWQKYKAADPAPVVAEPTTPRWLNISAADAAQIELLRAEADQVDTSPYMRSRLAKASLAVMGLDCLFTAAGPSGK